MSAPNPIRLLACQIPLATLPLVEDLIPTEGPRGPLALLGLMAVLFPYFVVAQSLSTGATFAVVGEGRGAWEALGRAATALPRLFPAAALASLLYLLGLPLLILPGLYFGAIYAFVPHVVLTSDPCPASVYLTRSKRVAKKRLGLVLAVTVPLFLLDFGVYLISSVIVSVAVTLVIGALANWIVARLFLKLRTEQP